MKDHIKIVLLVFALSLTFSSFMTVEAAQNDTINIYIEDKKIAEDLNPILKERRTYAPVRKLAETLQAHVEYKAEEKCILIKDEKKALNINMWIDETGVVINGEEIEIDAPVFVKNSRSYAPIRFLSESFNYEVNWDNKNNNIELISMEETEEKEEEEEEEEKVEEEKKEIYKPKLNVELEDKKILINVELGNKYMDEDRDDSDDEVKDLLSHEFIETKVEDNKLYFYFTGEKYSKKLTGFSDPLLEEINFKTILTADEIEKLQKANNIPSSEDDNKDTKNNESDQKKNKKDIEEYYADEKHLEEIKEILIEKTAKGKIETTNLNLLTLKLHYQVPESTLKYVDKLEDKNELKIELLRTFEVIKDKQVINEGLKVVNSYKGIKDGPVNINKLYFQPEENDLKLDLALANEKIKGLESIKDIAERNKAVAAINGGFFHSEGDPLGLVIRDGRLIRAPMYTRSVFILRDDGTKAIKQVDINNDHEAIISGDKKQLKLPVDSFNKSRGRRDTVIYTREYDDKTNTSDHSARGHLEFVVENDVINEINVGNSEIPENGYVISVHELDVSRYEWDQIKKEDTVKLNWDLEPDISIEDIDFALGAGPRLIKEGEVDITSEAENIPVNIGVGRRPCTAIGFFPNGEILLITIDGRAPGESIGFDLEEMADYLQKLGVEAALNLDGGGSTMMWLDGKIVNNPSTIPLRNISNSIIIRQNLTP